MTKTQTQAVDYLWRIGFFEEKRSPKEITAKIWELFKIDCSNISMILKKKKYLSNRKGWKQRYGASENISRSRDGENNIIVSYIEAGKPITALNKIEVLLEKLKGDILICDNYLGIKSMVNIYKMKNANSIKIICGSVKSDTKEMKNLIKDHNKEKNNLEVGIFDKTKLHDRYIITDDYLMILGHGFADLGNKESLVIMIPNRFVKDITNDLRNRFSQKWKGSKKF
jgi:hypothetical protein